MNDVDRGRERTLRQSPSGAVEMLRARDAIQRDLARVEERAHANLTKSYKAKRKVLHPDWGNPKHGYRARDEGVESSPAEEDSGVLVDEIADVSRRHCVLADQKADCIPGSIKGSMASGSGEVMVPLCSHEIPPGALHPAVGDPATERHGPRGETQKSSQG